MKKIMFVIAALVLITSGCKEKVIEVEPIDSSVSQETKDNQEDISTEEEDGEEEIVTNEPVYEVTRHEELTGGQKVVSIANSLNVSDFNLVESDSSQSYYQAVIPGLEKGKTYRFYLEVASDDIVNVEISDEHEISLLKKEATPQNGVVVILEEIVVASETSKETNISIGGADQMDILNVSMNRQVGQVVFADEFDYSGLPDNNLWDYEVGGLGWGNAELQYYTGGNLNNSEVKDGKLYIRALLEEKQNNNYTSARIRTIDGFTYGRVEVMAQLPYGVGTWPAIWMLPTVDRYGGWPNSGEIDIMEHVGFEMDVVHGSAHTGAFNFREGWHPTGVMTIPEVDATFHAYAIEWTPYKIDYYIDDYLYVTYKNDGVDVSHWPFDDAFYLILNVAVGGGWGGQQGVDDSVFPQEMVIDYVRVYELNDQIIDTTPPPNVDIDTVEITGNVVALTWEAVEDDYLVDYYEVWVDGSKYSETDKRTETLYHLDSASSYEVGVIAVDTSGNKSEYNPESINTEAVSYIPIPNIIEVDQIFFNDAGQIAFDDQQVSYLKYLEDGESMLYAVDVEASSTYQLEVSYNAKIFDGQVSLATIDGTELTSLVLEGSCEEDQWCQVVSEPFEIQSGQQLLRLNLVEGGFKLDYIRLKYSE